MTRIDSALPWNPLLCIVRRIWVSPCRWCRSTVCFASPGPASWRCAVSYVGLPGPPRALENNYLNIKTIISSVTRLGDLLYIGQLFKAFGNNYFAQISPHSEAIFANVSKSFFLLKSFWGNFYRDLAIFSGHTGWNQRLVDFSSSWRDLKCRSFYNWFVPNRDMTISLFY